MKRKSSNGEAAQTDGTKRRKREKKTEGDAAKNAKKAESDISTLKTELDISSPGALLKSIISPHSLEVFQDEYWEKKPLHIKRNNAEYYGNLFSLKSLLDILEKHPLGYEVDLNVCRYVDGEKEMMNGDDIAKASEVKDMVENKKATVQFHQPQRFSVRASIR